jgi:hypothetical protein
MSLTSPGLPLGFTQHRMRITFRISFAESNFSGPFHTESEKKYRTSFDRSTDTEQVSNSRKSLHVG